MWERAYRRRLERDLTAWQADGVVPLPIADAIRGRLPPAPPAITVTLVVAIVGGLLIAAAFLAFVAANWAAIARPLRLGMLLAGIFVCMALAAWFDHRARGYLADLATAVGTLIFGAALALIGQMYHLGDDFAGAMLLWAAVALLAAALTGSRGALAVALVTACIWNDARSAEAAAAYLPFAAVWLIAAWLAVMWNAAAARHMVAVVAVAAWTSWAIHSQYGWSDDWMTFFAFAAGMSLLFGAGLLLAARGQEAVRAFGHTLTHYAALALAVGLAFGFAMIWLDGYSSSRFGSASAPLWAVACGGAGLALACVAAAATRRTGTALAALAILLALAAQSNWVSLTSDDTRWLAYALGLAAMLSLLVSGVLDEARPRIVAGWIGLAAVIAIITWAVAGSLLVRSAFLAASGIAAIALALLLGRLSRRMHPS